MRLHDFFEYNARVHPEHPCIVDGERALSYDDVRREANRLVNALRASGVGPGDRFAYLSRNSADMVIAFLAASKSGATALPLNWRLAPREWQNILACAGARLVIAEDRFTEGFNQARAESLETFICIGDTREGWTAYRGWLAGQPDEAEGTDTGDDAALYQMYTSGTTGEPKGAVLPQRSVLSNSFQTLTVFEHRFCASDRMLIVMPMFHAGATSFVIGTLVTGATMVIHREFDPQAVVDELTRGITVVNLVPAMIQMMLLVPGVGDRDYGKLHTIIYGASPIAEETLRQALKIFHCQFYQGYGQTEASACLTFLNNDDHRRALDDKPELLLSAGRSIAGTEIRIVDSRGHDVPDGDIGQIIARGPQLMQGYWDMPVQTRETLREGWLYTGDAGRLDGEGYLYICDRVKDMIVSGGENIYPREIENVLFEHPAVADAAVIGIPDDRYGETVMAAIVVKKGQSLEPDEVVAHCRASLGGYKIPRRVEFLEALPRNASGKVLKKDLRAPYWKGHKRSVG